MKAPSYYFPLSWRANVLMSRIPFEDIGSSAPCLPPDLICVFLGELVVRPAIAKRRLCLENKKARHYTGLVLCIFCFRSEAEYDAVYRGSS